MATDPAMRNLFVYLVGFAGTGKLTIARAFARLVGAKVVDNHWINNPIFGLIDPDGVMPLPNEVWAQVAKVREAVLETIATLAKPGANFVFTHEGVEGDPVDQAVFESIRSAAARRGARFVPVRLLCEEGELVRRIQSPERAGLLKCVDPADAINKSRHHVVLEATGHFDARCDDANRRGQRDLDLAHIKSAMLDDDAEISAVRR